MAKDEGSFVIGCCVGVQGMMSWQSKPLALVADP
jgi:hypothetical protein